MSSSPSGSKGLAESQPLTATGGSFKRRDHLAAIEHEIRELWESQHVYEVDVPDDPNAAKFFATFPYPYMNGRLHLGHAFTITKAEFAARFQRLLGKKVLWPFAFHCTGMPICAAANKLRREIEAKSRNDKEIDVIDTKVDAAAKSEAATLGKFVTKRSKAVAKTGAAKTTWEVLQSLGVPAEEIPRFADPTYWLTYFPPLGMQDLKSFGLAVDWRRAFITTNVNPYYDAFVRWQYNTLRKRNCIQFGLRPSIFSPTDNQACADHDRLSGEGVQAQEYTLIKMKVLEIPSRWAAVLSQESDKAWEVHLVAATLRPETMYGQTNCFALPTGEYALVVACDKPAERMAVGDSSSGVLQVVKSKEEALSEFKTAFVCSRRSALNMSFQGIIPFDKENGTFYELTSIPGSELMGLPLQAPYSVYPKIYCLPMMNISMDKGSGVVTSVPSDSPDDYAALNDLKLKEQFRKKYNIEDFMVSPFESVDIIEVPGFSNHLAVDICNTLKITSQNDRQKLAEAKEECYRRGFYEGLMLVGSQKGVKVSEAKPKVRDELLSLNFASIYYEPERPVVSRSGDNCVVALCNQWFIDYSDNKWTREVISHIENKEKFTAFNERCRIQFKNVAEWIKEWACSRSFGLGSYLPWEEYTLIESLSDSTIYMAYYTIAHLLQGNLDGTEEGLLKIKSNQLTDEVFDYIFMLSDKFPTPQIIETHKLEQLRAAFKFWYPLDLRVSGKDLIFNHLTMSLFHHIAIWKGKMTPRSFFCNGHVLVDAEKMSKSLGNFLTLTDSVNLYTADCTRVALADAGDSLDDANFQRENANTAIMRLYLLDVFVAEFMNSEDSGREKGWPELAFENEMTRLVEVAKSSYERMAFRDALKATFFDFSIAKDSYKMMVDGKMNRQTILLWIETQAIILSPIAPHICEHLWRNHLGHKDSLVIDQPWPKLNQGREFDVVLHRQWEFLQTALEDFRKVKEKSMGVSTRQQQRAAKKNTSVPTPAPTKAIIFTAKEYLPWQQTVLKVLQNSVKLSAENSVTNTDEVMSALKTSLKEMDKKLFKEAMGFASYRLREELPSRGLAALELQLPFDELTLFQENMHYIERSLQVSEGVTVMAKDRADTPDMMKRADAAVPGKPSVIFL